MNDTIAFKPCGNSVHSTLVYTNNKQVFSLCTPEANVSNDIVYTKIGEILIDTLCDFKMYWPEYPTGESKYMHIFVK